MSAIWPTIRPPKPVVAIALGGVALSVALFLTLRDWERREREEQLAGLVREKVETLRISLLRSMEVLHSLAALHAADEQISRNQFAKFVEGALQRQPELLALSWNPVVSDDARDGMEDAVRRREGPGFQLRELNEHGEAVPAGRRPEYVPVRFIEPFDRNAAALGYDLNSDPRRKVSVDCARDRGQVVATAPVRLAQDRTEHGGFLVLLPVYRGATPQTLEERRRTIAGYAVAVFRLTDLVGTAFQDLHDRGVDVWLRDETPDDPFLAIEPRAGSSRTLASAARPEAVVPLELASRRLVVHYAAVAQYGTGREPSQSVLVLTSGLLLTLLGAAYLLNSDRRIREVAAVSRAKSDFLANMSHEVRTPLNAILGYTQLLQRDASLAPEQLDNLAGIRLSGQHLLGLVNEILDLSKIEAGRMERHDVEFELAGLARGLESTFRPLCAQRRLGFRIALDAPARTRRARGDEGKLRQILINLIGNAVKFTSAGEVVLQIRADQPGRWRFDVTDTGQGIPLEEQADIFKPFHQGNSAGTHGGTGLGLAIAQRQVELLGGELRVDSERGRGSRFYFDLPLERAADELPSAEVHVPAPTAGPDEPAMPIVPEVAGALPAEWRVRLPEDLQARLAVAAELHSTTALKACLQELRQHGPEAAQLADQIRHLMRSFDMDGIQHLLARATGPGLMSGQSGQPEPIAQAHGERHD